MIDGDDTYKASEMLRLLEPLESGFCDVVLGSRLAGKMTDKSMRGLNRLDNWFFSALVRVVYRVNVTDTLTGYFAWRREVIMALRPHIVSSGFAIEMEVITRQARLGFEAYSVPITYASRMGESALRPIRDGFRILAMFARQLVWRPPRRGVALKPSAKPSLDIVGTGERFGESRRPGVAVLGNAAAAPACAWPLDPTESTDFSPLTPPKSRRPRVVWRARDASLAMPDGWAQTHGGPSESKRSSVASLRRHNRHG